MKCKVLKCYNKNYENGYCNNCYIHVKHSERILKKQEVENDKIKKEM